MAAADLGVALDGEVNGDRLRAAADGDLLLVDGLDRLALPVAPDFDAVEDGGPGGDARHVALKLARHAALGLLRRGRGRRGEFRRPGRDHRVAALLVRLPHGLDAELPLLQSAVHAQLDGELLGGELRLARKLARALREDVVEALFEPAPLLALPLQ